MTGTVDHRTAAAGPDARPTGGWSLAPRRVTLLARYWVPLLVLALMVSSDYKYRYRDVDQALGGRPDLQILLEVATWGLVALLLGRWLLSTHERWTPARSTLLVLWTYAAYMALSVTWTVYPLPAVVRGVQWVISAVLAAVIARQATRAHLHTLVQWYVALVAASVLFGILFPFERLRLQAERFNWMAVHPVVAGTYLGAAVVLGAWLLWARLDRQPVRAPWPLLLQLPLLALCTYGLVATKTRGALGAAAIALALLALLVARRRRLEVLGLMGAGALVFALTALGPVLAYLSRGEPVEQIATFNGRFALWTLAWKASLETPVVGYGTNSSRGIFYDVIGLGGGHNAYVNVLVDGGVVGVVLFLAVLLGLVRLLVLVSRTPGGRTDVPLLASLLLYLAVNGMTTEHMGFVATCASLWLFVMVGWAGVLCRPENLPVRRARFLVGRARATVPAVDGPLAVPHVGSRRETSLPGKPGIG